LALSRTFDRFKEATPFLDALRRNDPDPALAAAQAEVDFKHWLIDGRRSALPAPVGSDLAKVVRSGAAPATSEATPIDFGAFSDKIYFVENRVYIGRWNCNDSGDGSGASLLVLDRQSLHQVGSVPLMPCDDEYQDAVSRVGVQGNRVSVTLEARYESEKRINQFDIDRTSLRIVSSTHVDRAPETTGFTSAETPHWHVSEVSSNGIESRNLEFKSLFDASTSRRVALGPTIDWSAVPGHDAVVVTKFAPARALHARVVDVPSGNSHTLIGLRVDNFRSAIDASNFYLSDGRDLIVVALDDGRIKAWITDFIPGGFRDNHHGSDKAAIDRLILDQGRLIALTADGAYSRTTSTAKWTP
jgi:hypothetical protein